MAAEPRLDRLELSMTDTCNLACDYCDVAHNLVECSNAVRHSITPYCDVTHRVCPALRAYNHLDIDVRLQGGV